MVQRSSRPSSLSSSSAQSSDTSRRRQPSQRRSSRGSQPNRTRRRRSPQQPPQPIPNHLLTALDSGSSAEMAASMMPKQPPNSSPKPPQPRRRKKQPRSRSPQGLAMGSRSQLKRAETQANPPTQLNSTRTTPMVRRPKRRRSSPMVYGARLLTLGIGIAVISGTVLSALSSLGRLSPQVPLSTQVISQGNAAPQSTSNEGLRAIPLDLQLRQEDTVLKRDITNLAQGLPQLDLGLLLLDMNTGTYVDIKGQSSFPSASTIKVQILVAFFQAVDTGAIRLDEMLTLEDRHIAGGSGDMQYQPSGTQFTALETATKMIVISDNTATNMLMERLGGAEALNRKFTDWGLKDTVLRNFLPDLPGTNKTSPRDLANVLTQVNQGGLISMQSRDRMFHIMEQTENNRLLPSGLGAGAIIAHKTGTLKSVLADVGLVDMTNGQRYLLAVLVGRRESNPDAEYLIRSLSQLIYQHFETPEPPPEETETPEDGEENTETTDSELTEDESLDSQSEDSATEWEEEAEFDSEFEDSATEWEEETEFNDE